MKQSSLKQVLLQIIKGPIDNHFDKPSFFRSGQRGRVCPITSTNNVIPLLQRHTCFLCLYFKYWIPYKTFVFGIYQNLIIQYFLCFVAFGIGFCAIKLISLYRTVLCKKNSSFFYILMVYDFL